MRFQETLCNLTSAADQNPFKATPQPEQVETAVLKALACYRGVLQKSTDEDQMFVQMNSFMYLLQVSLMRRGKGKIEVSHLESWIDECFPSKIHIQGYLYYNCSLVCGTEDVWQSIYRYTLRRRFDQVCLLLQSALDVQPNLSGPINILTELILSYPTAKERASSPYALSQWRLDLQTRLRLENISNWDSRLANIITLIEGDSIPPSVRAQVCNWQELFIGKLVLSAKSMEMLTGALVKECLAEKPSACPSIDALSAALIEGRPLDNEAVCALPLVGPHIIDLLALIHPNLAELRNSSIIQYANELAESILWNLCPDYLWATSVEGRNRLEALLFETAKSENRQQSVLDICHNFDLFILADAIHVMIAEEALKAQDHRSALTHAIQSGQNALVTRVCDAILEQFYAEKNVEKLALVDRTMFDSSSYPRLDMLLHIHEMERLRHEGHLGDAADVLIDQILASTTLLPAYLKPRLLEAFLQLAPSAPTDRTSISLRPVLELLNDASDSLDTGLSHRIRLLINQQAMHSFLMN